MAYSENDERIRKKGETYADDFDSATFRAKRLAVINQILDSREKYTPREWGIVQLYFKCGQSQTEIAWILGCSQQVVSYSLKTARRKALS